MPGNGNNYVTFYKANGQVAGRIEGENSSDWTNNRGLVLDVSEHATDVAMDGAALALAGYRVSRYTAILSWQIGKALSHIIPDSWCCAMLIPVGCIIIPFPGWPMPDWGNIAPAGAEVAGTVQKANDKAVDFIFAAASFASSSSFLGVSTNIQDTEYGVAYATGDGDYAEWMPRENPRRNFHARQIVGVKNGSISLNTTDFDHLMVISSAPAVLGNVPEEEFKEDYEKVAFLGQVPVDVIGRVNSGDYILPSGDNDGFGIAVDPSDISAEQIQQIVGVAWNEGLSDGFNTINVAVGLDHTATAQKFMDLKEDLGFLRSELNEIHALLMEEETSETTVSNLRMPLLKRLFSSRPGNSMLSERDSQVSQAEFGSPKAQETRMLQNMTTEDILSGVEETRLGNTPDAWKNANSKEVSTIIETVFETYVEKAEQDARDEAQRNRDEAGINFMQQTEFALDGYSSIDDVIAQQRQQMGEFGVNPTDFFEMQARFAGKILDKELTALKVRDLIREMPLNNPYLDNIRPGTQAEARFVEQVQAELFRSIKIESPEVAKNMPNLQSISENMKAVDRLGRDWKLKRQPPSGAGKSLK
jgi:hypothetical protein